MEGGASRFVSQAGAGFEEILEDYPYLDREDILALSMQHD